MEQMIVNQLNSECKSCVFTGHRELGEDFTKQTEKALKEEIRRLLESGVTRFFCGMARGFDLLAAEKLLSLKKKYPAAELIACIPCENQEKYLSSADKSLYRKVLKKADETVVLSTFYYRGCMLARDRYMADKADCMIAYCKKDTGGTAYTVKYFKKKKPYAPIIYL